MADQTLTELLVSKTQPRGLNISPAAVTMATWALVDTLSVGIAGSVLESEFVTGFSTSLMRRAGAGVSAALPAVRRTDAAVAAAVNAASVHTIDFDDSYLSGVKAHFSASIIPTAIAVAEETQASGGQCIEAIIRGFEVAARLGHVVVPSHLARWHPTGTLGVVGAAAAAAWLFGLNEQQAESALGFAADRATGSRFCLITGDVTKSLHAAWAAHDGITSARLAADGVRGPLGFFEGRFGYVATFSDANPDERGSLDSDRLAIEDNCTKFFPCMHGLQAGVMACLEIRNNRSEFDAREVAEVVIYQTAGRAHMGHNWAPANALAARLSLPYVIAVTLQSGACGLEQFSEELIHDSDLHVLMSRIRVESSTELEEAYGSRVASKVVIRFADGSEAFAEAVDPPGTPNRPATIEQRIDKFHHLAKFGCDAPAAQRILEACLALPGAPDVSVLTNTALEAVQQGSQRNGAWS